MPLSGWLFWPVHFSGGTLNMYTRGPWTWSGWYTLVGTAERCGRCGSCAHKPVSHSGSRRLDPLTGHPEVVDLSTATSCPHYRHHIPEPTCRYTHAGRPWETKSNSALRPRTGTKPDSITSGWNRKAGEVPKKPVADARAEPVTLDTHLHPYDIFALFQGFS